MDGVRTFTRLRLHCWLALLLFACASPLLAQVDHGQVTGTITDPTGAIVPGASITAVNQETKAQRIAVSSSVGSYALLNLPAGTYTITYAGAGFQTAVHTGVVIVAGQTVPLNVTLAVGSTENAVTVTGTPLLEVQPEEGTHLDHKAVTDLPISIAQGSGGRDQLGFAFALTPNVTGDSWYSSVNGSQQYTKNVLIDGTSIDSGVMGDLIETGPSLDAIEEFQVDTTGLRAEESHTGGGVFMATLKSGTNQWHGSAFGFLTNEALDANTWDNNWYLSRCASGDTACEHQYKRSRNRQFDYGFSGGGPIWKNHTFFYASYEKYSQQDWRAIPNGNTAPTLNMLQGDFSELLPFAAAAHGAPAGTQALPIINTATGTPYTDAAGNTIYYGSIFLPNGLVAPNNVIPQQYLSPIGMNIASIYKKYYSPVLPGVVNNMPRITSYDPRFQQYQFSIKFDHYFGSKDHFASSYIWNHRPKTEFENANSMWIPGSTDGGPLTSNSQQELHSDAYRFSETHTFTPNVLNVVSFTFNMFKNQQVSVAPSADWAKQIGLNSSYADKTTNFPQINFNGSPNGIGEAMIGSNYTGGYVAYNSILNETLSWIHGRQSLKFGAEIRGLGVNGNGGQQGGYTLNFSNQTYSPVDPQIQPYVGFAFANMLMGAAQSGSQNVPFGQHSRRKELAFFVQDDVKLTPKLTLSADLRWDITLPLHELNGYWTNFDLTAHNPAFGNVAGAYTWLKNPGDTFEKYADWHQLGPHIGLAYAPTNKLVARASYGVIYTPLANNQFGAIPYGSFSALGWTGQNNVNPGSDPSAPAFQWDAGYPGTTTAPTGPQPNSSYMPWGVVNFDPHSRQLGFTQNTYAGVEYAVASDTKLDVYWNGAYGRNLHDSYGRPYNFPQFSQLQPLLLSGHAYDWVSDPASAAAAGVPYPYSGFQQFAYNALLQYPQVSTGWGPIMFVNPPIGRSGYNGLTAEVTKRGHNGLSMDMSWNWHRQTGNVFNNFYETWSGTHWTQDPWAYNQDATRWPTTNQVVRGWMSYDLPFGRGRRFLGNASKLDYLVGGWTVSAIVQYGNGPQLGAVWSTNFYPGWSTAGGAVYTNIANNADFSNTFKGYNPGTLNDPKSQFVNPANFSNPTYGQLGNSPNVYQNWRGWANASENMSFMKQFHFGASERYALSLRADFFDVFNRHYWNNPITDFSSPYFGHVTGVTGNRTGQFGARFTF